MGLDDRVKIKIVTSTVNIYIFFNQILERSWDDLSYVVLISCREISEGAVQGIGVYSAGVGLKGPALESSPTLKKKKNVVLISGKD